MVRVALNPNNASNTVRFQKRIRLSICLRIGSLFLMVSYISFWMWMYLPLAMKLDALRTTALQFPMMAQQQQQLPVVVYSVARPDQSGAQVQDQLMAHAYAFAHNQTYGGACAVHAKTRHQDITQELIHSLGLDVLISFACPPAIQRYHQQQYQQQHQQQPQQQQRQQQQQLDELPPSPSPPQQLPPQKEQQPQQQQSLFWFVKTKKKWAVKPPGLATHKILPHKVYREMDTDIFTPEWLHHVQNQLKTSSSSFWNPQRSKQTLTVVLHIRRGGVTPCKTNRYISNGHYRRVLQHYVLDSLKQQQLQQQTPENIANTQQQLLEIHIHSQTESFEPWDDPMTIRWMQELKEQPTVSSVDLHLDAPLNKTWQDMIKANFLIMSRSSFSLVPAVLNLDSQHKIIYTPFWHKPLPHWTVVSSPFVEQAQQELTELQSQCLSQHHQKRHRHRHKHQEEDETTMH